MVTVDQVVMKIIIIMNKGQIGSLVGKGLLCVASKTSSRLRVLNELYDFSNIPKIIEIGGEV